MGCWIIFFALAKPVRLQILILGKVAARSRGGLVISETCWKSARVLQGKSRDLVTASLRRSDWTKYNSRF